MSVFCSAIIGHRWNGFSQGTIEQISKAVSDEQRQPEWLKFSQHASADEEFTDGGVVTFGLPGRFSLTYATNLLDLGYGIRWTAFLIHKIDRTTFLSACKKVVELARTTELILLPEGTGIQDDVRSGIDFEEIKRQTFKTLGPPDLDIRKIYTEDEINRFSQSRVHYFLVDTTEL